jgi:hypothetical protein
MLRLDSPLSTLSGHSLLLAATPAHAPFRPLSKVRQQDNTWVRRNALNNGPARSTSETPGASLPRDGAYEAVHGNVPGAPISIQIERCVRCEFPVFSLSWS